MGLTTSQRRVLGRKATGHSLEVEDLLRLSGAGGPEDAAFVRALKNEHAWPDTGREGRTRVVPLGRWAEVVCRFWEDGYAGLVVLAREPGNAADFCLSLLEELKAPESVAAVLAIGGPVIADPGTDVAFACRWANAFNLLLAFKGRPAVSAETEQRVRAFLHLLLGQDLSEIHRAGAVCALRGVGDASSIALISGLPPFRGSWAGLERTAVRQIKFGLRRQRGESGPRS